MDVVTGSGFVAVPRDVFVLIARTVVQQLGFKDLLVQTDRRTVRNTADLSFLFFDVGKVDLTIRRLR